MMSSEKRSDPRLRAALDAFIEFRVADMDIWRRAGTELDLTTNGMMVLAYVLRQHSLGEVVRQVDICNALRLSAAGASTIIDVLEERELVRREPFAGDRRALSVVPTLQGSKVEETVRIADDRFFELADSVTPAELDAFVRILDGMRVHGLSQFRSER
ncbi:MarR family winged helix-turn-helix transcriptional regulator [Arenivirga flava]|nr:helix-turn-helix domain-containing protein [Arenivirga flava]